MTHFGRKGDAQVLPRKWRPSVARHQEHKSERLCPPRLGIRVATETSTVKRRTRLAFCTQGRDEDEDG